MNSRLIDPRVCCRSEELPFGFSFRCGPLGPLHSDVCGVCYSLPSSVVHMGLYTEQGSTLAMDHAISFTIIFCWLSVKLAGNLPIWISPSHLSKSRDPLTSSSFPSHRSVPSRRKSRRYIPAVVTPWRGRKGGNEPFGEQITIRACAVCGYWEHTRKKGVIRSEVA